MSTAHAPPALTRKMCFENRDLLQSVRRAHLSTCFFLASYKDNAPRNICNSLLSSDEDASSRHWPLNDEKGETKKCENCPRYGTSIAS